MHYITKDVVYVGVNDHAVDLFEGQYVVPNGMSYNSYVVLDEKVCVFDTVDQHFTHEWLDNVEAALNGRKPDYLIVQHMEPDHSANIDNFVKTYPDVTVVGNAKTFAMMEQFFGCAYENRLVVKDGDTLELGGKTLTFCVSPNIHWPDTMMTYLAEDKILFSCDFLGAHFAEPTMYVHKAYKKELYEKNSRSTTTHHGAICEVCHPRAGSHQGSGHCAGLPKPRAYDHGRRHPGCDGYLSQVATPEEKRTRRLRSTTSLLTATPARCASIWQKSSKQRALLSAPST